MIVGIVGLKILRIWGCKIIDIIVIKGENELNLNSVLKKY